MEFKLFESMIHPIRMRIIQETIKKKEATVRDISEALNDVPPASLYRQINKLVADGILRIAAENKVRGTLEKVYTIQVNPYEELDRVLNSHEPQQLLSLFYHFEMTLLSDFQSYLSQESIHPEQDGVGFRSYHFYQTDEEFAAMVGDMKALFLKHLKNKPSEGRKHRKLSTVITPIEN